MAGRSGLILKWVVGLGLLGGAFVLLPNWLNCQSRQRTDLSGGSLQQQPEALAGGTLQQERDTLSGRHLYPQDATPIEAGSAVPLTEGQAIPIPPIPTPPPPLPTPTVKPSASPSPSFPFAGLDHSLAMTEEAALYQSALSAFLNSLEAQGYDLRQQGVLLMTAAGTPLAAYQSNQAFPAASLTKLATSMAAIRAWGLDYQFTTQVYVTGSMEKGVLQGSVWIQGGNDPYFRKSDAIDLAQQLRNQGIESITEGVKISGSFYMEGSLDPHASGEQLLQELIAAPQGLNIRGSAQVTQPIPANARPLLRHTSAPLSQILKILNAQSNNDLANRVTAALGGVSAVQTTARSVTLEDPLQLRMVNGSGLAYENAFSAEALGRILQVLEREPSALHLILPEAGVGESTLNQRTLPLGTVAKSGSLNGVATLAGQLPSGILFVFLNQGPDQATLQALQDRFLQDLMLLDQEL